ncbi:phage neck terminator protein [Apilactobacillus timberlakei]|uniref:phage neck terminator protein n=1 Tax=Apilactobacillus timberlakei TaxID=2008380 RepID=UPI00112A4C0C|nr:hypothetical protein [Apilactobacillus timberlakei]TPR16646.1 hypothetical protein DYZ95_07330 [Apilactobacillus timberlakei]
MPYQAKTFDWVGLFTSIKAIVEELVGIPCIYENSKDETPPKPFVSYGVLNDHTSLNYQTNRDNEAFMTTLTFKGRADSMGEAVAIKDDLRTLLQGYHGRDELKKNGIILAPNPIQNERSADSNSIPFMEDAVAGFDLVIQLQRHYQSNYQQIKNINIEHRKEDLHG